ncbi:citrate transporter [Ruminococcaceae bacterium OttesenSCG-928-A16]|nr:citrate transporter [Ruminococcaceae bacterium OttesenSCG-928-A16]
MEYIIGSLLLISFFALVIYAVRGGNLMLGMFVMAVLWTVLPLVGNALVTNPGFLAANFMNGEGEIVKPTIQEALTKVFQGGPEGWGSVLVNVVFGAWFGRVLLQTGIASTLIRKTVELGGDKPVIIAVLLSIVTTAIFSSMFGAGAVVAIGVIILPILISLGIPKEVAIVSFMFSVGSGMLINPVLTTQFTGFFVDDNGQKLMTYADHVRFGLIAMAVQLVITIVYCIFALRPKRRVHAWSVSNPNKVKMDFVPNAALLSPVIPVVLLIAFKVPIILGFVIGSLYALAICGKLKSWRGAARVINKDFFDGVVDTAPLVGFLLVLPMFNKAAELCVPYFNALLGGVIPQSTLVISLAFIVLAPLGLFRGPLTLYGGGAAVLGILKGIGFYTPEYLPWLFTLMLIPSTVMNVTACITQSWVAWGIGYTKVSARDYLRRSVPLGWISSAILQAINYFMYGIVR